VLIPIINPSLYSTLFYALYIPTSTVMYGAHDIDDMTVSLLRYPMYSIGVSP